MKTYKFTGIFSVAFILFFVVSCEEYLEVIPKDELSTESIFQTEAGADLFLLDIYEKLPDYESYGSNDGIMQRMHCYDPFADMYSPWQCNKHRFVKSYGRSIDRNYSADQLFGATAVYNQTYPSIPFFYERVVLFIRSCNLFLESIEENKDSYTDAWYTERKAESRALRAYFYHWLWMAYGGVPLIDEVLNLVEMGDDIFQPSASIKELYEWMVTELGEAAADLPNEIGEGRVTKGSALALEAWIHLFMGDIARDPRPAEIFPADMTYATAAYNACIATCQEIIDLGTYSLFPQYTEMFYASNNGNSESMWTYQHVPQLKYNARWWRDGPRHSDNASHHSGNTMPSQALVDMYRMSNGLPISHPGSGYNPLQPYLNREQRFYESIIYDSCTFNGRLYTLEGTGSDEILAALANQNKTGYFRRKGIDPKYDNLGTSAYDDYAATMFFRYTEVLLMYVEARIKAGAVDQQAMNLLDQVRERGGIPSVAESYGTPLSGMSQQEQEDLIFNERVVEMAFEYKGYFDIIRWRKAEEYLNVPLLGVERDSVGGYKTFVAVDQKWDDDKYYLFPIYRGWLEQNPAWMDPANQVDGRTEGQNLGY